MNIKETTSAPITLYRYPAYRITTQTRLNLDEKRGKNHTQMLTHPDTHVQSSHITIFPQSQQAGGVGCLMLATSFVTSEPDTRLSWDKRGS